MKRSQIYAIFSVIVVLALSSCAKTDEYADWKYLNDQWLEKHKTDSGFVQTSSGLCYEITHQGVMRNPNDDSVVKVKYTGTLIDGTQFDSGTYFNYLSTTIAGWRELLPKLKGGGGRCIVYVPYTLGYGSKGSGGSIPPYSTLVFQIELVDSY